MRNRKAEFQVGDHVIVHGNQFGMVTGVVHSIAYEIDHYPYLYQPDEIDRQATARERGPSKPKRLRAAGRK